MSKVVAIILVRMGSERLPGKPLIVINGKTILEHLITRVKQSRLIDEIVVATSTSTADTLIENLCTKIKIPCFRGSENDVLERMLNALKKNNASTGVTIYGDCPVIDFRIIDELIHFFQNNSYDFVGNNLKTTFPPGMEAEVFKVSALESANQKATSPEIREHATLFIRQNPQIYKIHNIEASNKHCRPELEIELDTKKDLEIISTIIDNFKNNSKFSLLNIIDFLDQNPSLKNHNTDVERKWKKYRNEQ